MRKLIYFIFLFVSLSQSALANDLKNAPPQFPYRDSFAVPVDFLESNLEMNIDIQTLSITCNATIEFYSELEGYPIFDLVPNISKMTLNQSSVNAAIHNFQNVTSFRILNTKVASKSKNILTISYVIPINMQSNSPYINFGFWMSDGLKGGRKFLEQYAPANFEFDQFRQKINLKVLQDQDSYQLIANGLTTLLGPNEWFIEFPDYFTASSFYLHLFHTSDYQIKNEQVKINDKTFELTAYGKDDGRMISLERETAVIKQKTKEFSEQFGNYAHQKMIVFFTYDSMTGMEYSGAFTSTQSSMIHELFHMWYGRSVIPADGNSGWLDEAIGMWRQTKYPRRSTLSDDLIYNLASNSPYQRHTEKESYTKGKEILAHIDYLLIESGQLGLKEILKLWFLEKQNQVISTQEFENFLSLKSGIDFSDIFRKYIYAH